MIRRSYPRRRLCFCRVAGSSDRRYCCGRSCDTADLVRPPTLFTGWPDVPPLLRTALARRIPPPPTAFFSSHRLLLFPPPPPPPTTSSHRLLLLPLHGPLVRRVRAQEENPGDRLDDDPAPSRSTRRQACGPVGSLGDDEGANASPLIDPDVTSRVIDPSPPVDSRSSTASPPLARSPATTTRQSPLPTTPLPLRPPPHSTPPHGSAPPPPRSEPAHPPPPPRHSTPPHGSPSRLHRGQSPSPSSPPSPLSSSSDEELVYSQRPRLLPIPMSVDLDPATVSLGVGVGE